MFQHVTWFFGHSEVYVQALEFALLAIGGVWLSRALLRRGLRWALVLFLGAVVALIVWHVFAIQQAYGAFARGEVPGRWIELAFVISSVLALGVLAAGLIANWRSVRANPVGIAFLLSGLLVLAGGWLLGRQFAGAGIDAALHDTYYVRAHYDYVVTLVLAFGGFALVYFGMCWLVGVDYNRWLGGAHWLVWTAGILLMALPQYVPGNRGMPRRYADYSEAMSGWQVWSSAGLWLILISVMLFVACLGEAIIRRVRSGRGASCSPAPGEMT